MWSVINRAPESANQTINQMQQAQTTPQTSFSRYYYFQSLLHCKPEFTSLPHRKLDLEGHELNFSSKNEAKLRPRAVEQHKNTPQPKGYVSWQVAVHLDVGCIRQKFQLDRWVYDWTAFLDVSHFSPVTVPHGNYKRQHGKGWLGEMQLGIWMLDMLSEALTLQKCHL